MIQWEGISDLYGDCTMVGGVLSKPAMDFNLQIIAANPGEQSWENPLAMIREYPNNQAYVDDKRAKIEVGVVRS